MEAIVKIKMLETRTGSPDGIIVRSYTQGEQYELPDALAAIFIAEGWAKPAVRKIPGAAGEGIPGPGKKDRGAAVENKSRTRVKK